MRSTLGAHAIASSTCNPIEEFHRGGDHERVWHRTFKGGVVRRGHETFPSLNVLIDLVGRS